MSDSTLNTQHSSSSNSSSDSTLNTQHSTFIPLSVPSFQGNELKYVTECIETEWVSTAGAYVERFEKEMATYLSSIQHSALNIHHSETVSSSTQHSENSSNIQHSTLNTQHSLYAIACANGTAALHVSLLLAGVMPGMEVIVPALTFIAPINTVHYAGARPVFMDCDDYLNIDVEKTADFCVNECMFDGQNLINKKSGAVIKAIIPVHIFGHPVNIEPLMELAGKFNLTIIEDATESLGSYYKTGKFAGKRTATVGKLGCLSFNGNKIITTGGGGMLITSDRKLAEKAKYLTTQAKDDEVYYVHNDIGFNYRMTNVQAALGVAQLEKLPEYVKIKRENYGFLKEKISKIPGLSLIDEPDYSFSNYWMYSLKIEPEYGLSRDDLLKKFAASKIQTRPVWKLNHQQLPYQHAQAFKIEKALDLYEMILNIPCSISLKGEDLDRVCAILDNR